MDHDCLSFSQLDSARFGINILRGKFDSIDCKSLANAIFSTNCDIAIIRIPSATSQISQLSKWSLPILHADTLVYYRCDLTKHCPPPPKNSTISFRKAAEDDVPSLRALIADTFENYTSHYHANSILPRSKILEGYQQWAENHVDHPNTTLWIAERDGVIVAFAACAEHAETSTGEGVLYGVSPNEKGGGIYGDLIRFTQAEFRSRGFQTMLVSTQINNFAVQKVWTREGFHLFQAWDTYHVNALLTHGESIYSEPVIFSKHQITAFANASGDTNPIHLDADAARASGFPGRISHGVLAAAELSRILGTKAPGPGTIFSHLDMTFLRPILADTAYKLDLRIPGGIKRPGHMHGILTIRDADNHICTYAHMDLVVRQ